VACLATSWLVAGCVADTGDATTEAPPHDALKAPTLEVFVGDGTEPNCPPDMDGGFQLCALQCPKNDPVCGVLAPQCSLSWDTNMDGEVTGAECVALTSGCLDCCLKCLPPIGNSQCATNCLTF
jgi:hypothetical protein